MPERKNIFSAFNESVVRPFLVRKFTPQVIIRSIYSKNFCIFLITIVIKYLRKNLKTNRNYDISLVKR